MVTKFSELVYQFTAWASHTKAPSTLAQYQHFYRAWLREMGDTNLSDLTPALLMRFGSTWHRAQAIKRLLSWGVNEACLLSDNPIAKVRLPKKGSRKRILSRHERVRFLRSCKPDLRSLLIALYESAARPQEMRLAEWEDLVADLPGDDLHAALARGRASIVLWEFKDQARRISEDKPRVILLSPRLCRLLSRLLKRTHKATGRIFRTARGRGFSANALRCRFRRLRKKLSVERDKRGETVVPYPLRHTAATAAAAAGVRDRLLADVLGHVETRTTARYCHLQVDHLREAMQSVWEPCKRQQR
mgnify:CR=1 FL=1